MAKGSLGVYKDCVSKVLHPSLNAVIHSVLVGQGCIQLPNQRMLSRLLHGKRTICLACVCYILAALIM